MRCAVARAAAALGVCHPAPRALHAAGATAAKASSPAVSPKKKKDDGARPQETGRMDPDVATGVNILKGGSDPKLPGDDACPPWLSGLADVRPTLSELQRRNAGGASGAAPQRLTVTEGLRLLRMQRRAEIKASNATGGKE